MKKVLMHGIFASFLAISSFSSVAYAQQQGQQDLPPTLIDPSAESIVVSHEQRVANIQYEMQQVMDLINQYKAFKGRLDRVLPERLDHEAIELAMDREIEKYWKVYNRYEEILDLLKDLPPVRIKLDSDLKDNG